MKTTSNVQFVPNTASDTVHNAPRFCHIAEVMGKCLLFCWCAPSYVLIITSQKHGTIMRDAAVKGFRNSHHLYFFRVHLNLSTRPSIIFAYTLNAITAAEI